MGEHEQHNSANEKGSLKSSQVINKCGFCFYLGGCGLSRRCACNGALVMAFILYTGDHCDSFISWRISAVYAGECELN